jgi:hypothetical protein
MVLERHFHTGNRPARISGSRSREFPTRHHGRVHVCRVHVGGAETRWLACTTPGGKITLLVAQVVSYPLPLTSPPVLIDWNERRFQVIAEAGRVDTTVSLCLCRDRGETLKKVLGSRRLVVLGGRRKVVVVHRAEKRLARQLKRSGYEVILIESE